MRHGSILDVFFIGVLALALIFFGFTFFIATNQINQTCQSTVASLGMAANWTTPCNQIHQMSINFLGTVPLIIGAGGLGAIVTASVIPVSPVLLPAGILMLLIAVILFFNIQAELGAIFTNTVFASVVAQNPILSALGQNIVWIVLVIGALILIVTYGRIRSSGGGLPEA